MMRKWMRAALGVGIFLTAALSSAQDPDGVRITNEIRTLLVLNQLSALHLTAKQMKPIYRQVEHGHDTASGLRREENDALEEHDAMILEAIKAAENRDMLTTGASRDEIRGLVDDLAAKRARMIIKETDSMVNVALHVLSQDQINVAENVLDLRWLAPSLVGAKMSDAFKLRMFCRFVFLDDASYDYLKDKVEG